MGGAGVAEGLIEVGRDAGFDAKEDTCKEGGFGVGVELVDGVQCSGFEGEDGGEDGVALVAGEEGSVGEGEVGVDAFPGEVVAVGEGFVFGRGLELAAQGEAVAVLVVGAGVHAGKHQAGDRDGFEVFGEADSFGLDAEVGVGVALVGWVDEQASDGDVETGVVVMGDEARVGQDGADRLVTGGSEGESGEEEQRGKGAKERGGGSERGRDNEREGG